MPPIFPGRYTAHSGEPFVVFLIGMRINRLLAVPSWTRVARAMPPMIAELKRQPELGLLHAEFFIYWRGVATHLPAWAEFNRRIGNNGLVGIWHETYTVAPGQYESVYVNMPRFGLGSALDYVPAIGRLNDARSRMTRPSRELKADS